MMTTIALTPSPPATSNLAAPAAAGATAVFDDMSLLAQALLKRLDIDRERNG